VSSDRSLVERALREVKDLSGFLREAVRSSGTSLKAVSLELGYAPPYLSRVLSGIHALKVRQVFAILTAVGKRPTLFLSDRYPLAPPIAATRRRKKRSDLPLGPSARQMREEVESRKPPPDPKELAEKTASLLRGVLLRKHVRQRAVSRSLGLKDDTLGRALRGEADLLAFHLFGTLAAVGMTPGRFFAELFSGDETGGEIELSRAELWDVIERLVGGGTEQSGDEGNGDGEK
jgi:transcriptional regulator with XRE-family HTH domain